MPEQPMWRMSEVKDTMGSSGTTNPLTIMFINMTVVFVVLYGLSLIIRLTKKFDPTQKKKLAEQVQPAPAVVEQAASAEYHDEDEEAAVIIAAAVAACGYGVVSIKAVHPAISRAWRQAGRLEGIGNNLRTVER